MKKMVNGVLIECTDDEIKARQKQEADWVANADTRLAEQHRLTRNNLLAETDWTQLDDVPQATKDKYKSWRQELRDLPQHSDFPNVTIPSEPE